MTERTLAAFFDELQKIAEGPMPGSLAHRASLGAPGAWGSLQGGPLVSAWRRYRRKNERPWVGPVGERLGKITDIPSNYFENREGIKKLKERGYTPSSPDEIAKAVGRALAMKKLAERVLYHGSPQRIEKLELRTDHGDPRMPPAVFATPDPLFALAYAGKKWGDRDINQEVRGGPKGRMILREMRPGALQDIYGGQTGYLHHLPAETFEAVPGRRTTKEVISRTAVTPSKVEEVRDVLERLKRTPGVELASYDPKSRFMRTALKRQVSRMLEMPPEGRDEYKRWRLEVAPTEVRDLFEKELSRAMEKSAERSTVETPVRERVLRRFAEALREQGADVGTHKRILIPKSALTKADLTEHLGFSPSYTGVPELGQRSYVSYRHPDNLFHLHDHGTAWVMHEDQRSSANPLHALTEGIPAYLGHLKDRVTGGDGVARRVREALPDAFLRRLRSWAPSPTSSAKEVTVKVAEDAWLRKFAEKVRPSGIKFVYMNMGGRAQSSGVGPGGGAPGALGMCAPFTALKAYIVDYRTRQFEEARKQRKAECEAHKCYVCGK